MVIDASAVVEILRRSPRGQQVEQDLLDPTLAWHAPHLLDVEVTHVLRRYALSNMIDERRGREALDDLASLPISRYPHDMLLPRIWELRHNLTAYDATYIVLAEILQVPLVTGDRRLASTPGHSVKVVLI